VNAASSPTRFVAGFALAGVSLIAAVASYLHAFDVVRDLGAVAPLDYLIPFLADLVILGCSASMLTAARTGTRLPRLTIAGLVVAIGVTLAMNVAAGWHHGAGGRLVAGWPALAFLLALEALSNLLRRGRDGECPQLVPAAGGHCPHGVAGTAEEAVLNAYSHARDCLLEPVSFRQLEARFGVRRDRVSELVKASSNGSGPDGE
jgi:hypothetical protein